MLNMTGLLLHPHSTFKGKHTLKITEMEMKQGRRGTGACCFSYILVEQLSYPLTAVLLCRECVPWECPCSIGYYIYIYIYMDILSHAFTLPGMYGNPIHELVFHLCRFHCHLSVDHISAYICI